MQTFAFSAQKTLRFSRRSAGFGRFYAFTVFRFGSTNRPTAAVPAIHRAGKENRLTTLSLNVVIEPRLQRWSFTITGPLARHQKLDLLLHFRDRDGSQVSVMQLLVELRQPGLLESGPLRDARFNLLA